MDRQGKSQLNLTVLLLLSVCPLISSYNILVVSPAVSKSHFSVGEAITIGLSDTGHNVTLISPYDYKPKNPNIEHVHLTGLLEKAEGIGEHFCYDLVLLASLIGYMRKILIAAMSKSFTVDMIYVLRDKTMCQTGEPKVN